MGFGERRMKIKNEVFLENFESEINILNDNLGGIIIEFRYDLCDILYQVRLTEEQSEQLIDEINQTLKATK